MNSSNAVRSLTPTHQQHGQAMQNSSSPQTGPRMPTPLNQYRQQQQLGSPSSVHPTPHMMSQQMFGSPFFGPSQGSPFLGSPQMAGNVLNPYQFGFPMFPQFYSQSSPQTPNAHVNSTSSANLSPRGQALPNLPCPCCLPGAEKCPCRLQQDRGYETFAKEEYFQPKSKASTQLAREIRNTVKTSELDADSEDTILTRAVIQVSKCFVNLAPCTPNTHSRIRSRIKACLNNKSYYNRKKRKELSAKFTHSDVEQDTASESEDIPSLPKSKKAAVTKFISKSRKTNQSLSESDDDATLEVLTGPTRLKKATNTKSKSKKSMHENLFGTDKEKECGELASPLKDPEFTTTNERSVQFDLNDVVIIGQGRTEYDFAKVDRVSNDRVCITYLDEKLVPMLKSNKSKEIVWKDDVLLNTIIMSLGKRPIITDALKAEINQLTLELYPDEYDFI